MLVEGPFAYADSSEPVFRVTCESPDFAHNLLYLVAIPLAFAIGYFALFLSIFSVIIRETSILVALARLRLKHEDICKLLFDGFFKPPIRFYSLCDIGCTLPQEQL